MSLYETSLVVVFDADSLSQAHEDRDRMLRALRDAGFTVAASTTQPAHTGHASGHGAFGVSVAC